MRFLPFLLLTVATITAYGQKTLQARRTSAEIKIDGHTDESGWKAAPIISDFVQQTPYNGQTAQSGSQVQLLYNDRAIYIAAKLQHADSLPVRKEVGQRDAGTLLNADWFSVEINPYNDKLRAFEFMVSASGVQSDMLNSLSGSDTSWDAVWKSKVRVEKDAWYVEMEIPYTALRFPKEQLAEWNINFYRMDKNLEEVSSWNRVNNEIEGRVNQMGTIRGLENIEPPLRLSVMPYLTTYLDKNPGEKHDFRPTGGLDLKYGINESFTLDMMLIPDFGQVQSDDQVVNLTTVETYFNEQRQFFTEGADIFNKGGIFYSRRIGAEPINYGNAWSQLRDGETLTENPDQVSLYNATKLSGRTKSGLGIGVLNAVTQPTYAKAKHNETGKTRQIETQGLTNYNVFVLDQNLHKQSFVSFTNTNVLSPNDDFLANVSASQFRLSNKAGSYSITGRAAFSHNKVGEKTENGMLAELNFHKNKGRFLFSQSNSLITDTYNPSALGYLAQNNLVTHNLALHYNDYRPKKHILQWTNMLNIHYEHIFKPYTYSNAEIYFNSTLKFKNQHIFTVDGSVTPAEKYDFFEPRVEGRKYTEPTAAYFGLSYTTDRRKTLSAYIHLGYWATSKQNKEYAEVMFTPNLRISNRFSIALEFYYGLNKNGYGWAYTSGDQQEIIFSRRNEQHLNNVLNLNFALSNKAFFTARLRHYWSRFDYVQYYRLKENGHMDANTDYTGDHDFNMGIFNADLMFTWRFAPGSEFNISWKRAGMRYVNEIENLGSATKALFEMEQGESISLRVLYYLDFKR